jgi:hypothetical protein
MVATDQPPSAKTTLTATADLSNFEVAVRKATV